MRKIATAVLAVPVLAVIYAVTIWHRPRALRAIAGGAFAFVALVAAIAVIPRPTSATPAATSAPIAAEQFGPDVASVDALSGAVELSFARAMDTTSVEAALSVSPSTPVRISWVDPGRRVRVTPSSAWTPATYFTVAVASSARTADGQILGAPVIKGFYTRRQTTGAASAAELADDGTAARDGGFVIDFDRPVQAESAKAAFRISPTVTGAIEITTNALGGTRLVFTPARNLKASTVYTVSLEGSVYDADGAVVAALAPLEVTSGAAVAKATPKPTKKPAPTPKATARASAKPTPTARPATPAVARVVRFRPVTGTTKVTAAADLSVRFTRAMDRARTQKAFQVFVKGKRIAGSYSWFEKGTVLVFNPKSNLPFGARVTMKVTTAARTADGGKLAKAVATTFTVAAKPKVVDPPSGGGGGGGGAWASVERYYLGLMNCTRQGGWVTSNGKCSSPGGSGIPALELDAGISSKVSRPYAKLLATTGVCSHFYRGNPGTRLRAAGYSSYRWAENLGCRSAKNAYASVLGTHQYFQSERNWRPQGGHWVNMMNRAYDRVGIGVYVHSGRVRLVVSFYHP